MALDARLSTSVSRKTSKKSTSGRTGIRLLNSAVLYFCQFKLNVYSIKHLNKVSNLSSKVLLLISIYDCQFKKKGVAANERSICKRVLFKLKPIPMDNGRKLCGKKSLSRTFVLFLCDVMIDE